MRLHSLYGAVVCTTLYWHANAANWMIDWSCDAASGKQGFVRNTMDTALEMAQAALDAANQVPIDPAVQAALDFLFNNGYPTLPIQYAQTRVFGGLNGMLRLDTEATSNGELEANDVKIYCDQSRIIRVNKDGESYRYDLDTQLEVAEEEYSSCSIARGGMMYTLVPTLTEKKPKTFMQIQYCPSFLSWAIGQRNLWTVGLTANNWKKLSIDLLERFSTKTLYTAIDGLSLADKMMVHELSHATRGYATIDAKVGGILGDRSAYGWKQCKKISTVTTEFGNGVTGGEGPHGPETNADTFALFASIAWQLETNKITSVNEDGSFVAF